MFVDARSMPSGTLIEADLCIVGGGAAGIALAHRFIGTGVRVCLFESGGLDLDWQVQALAAGESVGEEYSGLDSCQLRYFGGNTNAWGGWFRAFDDIDFRRRPWVADSGWPVRAGELEPYYAAVHALCEVPCDKYDVREAVAALGEPLARLIPFDPARLESALYRFSPPTRFGQTYREAIARAENVRCFTNAHVLRVRTTADARRVTGLALGCLSGLRFDAIGSVFVLAAGSIENARLLLLSNDVVAAGLGNHNGLVGRYFMDHPHVKRMLIPGPRPMPLGLYGLSFRHRGICTGISLPAALQEHEELLNYKASIYPLYMGHGSRGWQAFRNLALSLHPQWRSDPYDRFGLPFVRKGISARQLGTILRQLDKVLIAGLAQVVKPDRFVRRYFLESKPEQAPNPESRVGLSPQRDAFGLNLARLDWRLLPIDRRTAVRAEELIDAELRRLGIGRLAPLLPGERDAWPGGFSGGWHQMGTTRAHEDPRRGVVDGQCKVHGVGNLFIAGASVFPTGGAVSPTPTVLALALRLADHLKARLREPALVA